MPRIRQGEDDEQDAAVPVSEMMGRLYEDGIAFPENFAKARHYYESEVSEGDDSPSDGSLYRLGIMAERGEGEPVDPGEAAAYFLRAAQDGNLAARVGLHRVLATARLSSSMYRPLDPALLDSRGLWDIPPMSRFPDVYRSLGYVEMSDPASWKALLKAVRNFKVAALHGFAPAMNAMGAVQRKGLGVPQDFAGAVRWYHRAELGGDAMAEEQAEVLRSKGFGAPDPQLEALRDRMRKRRLLSVIAGWYAALPAHFSAAGPVPPWLTSDGTKPGYPMLPASQVLPESFKRAWKELDAATAKGRADGAGSGLSGAVAVFVHEPEARDVPSYLKAARAGDADAQWMVGLLDRDKKPARSVHWFRLAAEQGLREAQYGLAQALKRGVGTGRDLAEAYVWFDLAAADGSDPTEREEVRKRLPAPAVAAAQRQASRWWTTHPSNRNRCVNWSHLSAIIPTPKDRARIALNQRLARQGVPEAEFQLGFDYLSGIGVPMDQRRARDLFVRAAANGAQGGARLPGRSGL